MKDPWLPVGMRLPDGAEVRKPICVGDHWQILAGKGGTKILVVDNMLESRWISAGLIDDGQFKRFVFAGRSLSELSSGNDQMLVPISDAQAPANKQDALSFAAAFKATRSLDPSAPLQDAIFVEKISRLLPTYTVSAAKEPEVVAGYCLTGGIDVAATSLRRMHQAMGWLSKDDLQDVIRAAGLTVAREEESLPQSSSSRSSTNADKPDEFELAGRPELAAFFNEHVIDIVRNRDRYKALGVGFPAAMILHGPPGCGKTYAVQQLVDFLGWPSFEIDASSVASPYIHETSKKVASVFEDAMSASPSVLIIDEMEAFLADRETGSGHHRVEEVAEFLRRIPEAHQNDVLIIAMTNRIDMIDEAILRRGRFDHVIEVAFASEAEVDSLLQFLLSKIPCSSDIDRKPLAAALAGRPLSDVTFVVREGSRLAARSGAEQLEQANLIAAMKSTPRRDKGEERRPAGF